MRRRLTVAVILVALLLAALLVWGRLTRAPALLDRARFAADVSSWGQSWWLDDDHVVFIPSAQGPGWSASVLDLRTGAHTQLRALSATLDRLMSRMSVHRMEVSPDGRWMVAAAVGPANPATHFLIRVADGKVMRRETAGSVIGWLPDSSGWAGALPNPHHGVRVFRLLGGVRRGPPPPAIVGADLGLTASGHQLHAQCDAYSPGPLKVHDIDLQTGRIVRTTSVALPRGSLLFRLALSRDTRRLMLQVRPAPSILASILGSIPRKAEEMHSVWVADIDGSHMRRIGEVPVHYGLDAEHYGTDYDTDVRVEWLPSGRGLAVTLKGKLYTVPVPPS